MPSKEPFPSLHVGDSLHAAVFLRNSGSLIFFVIPWVCTGFLSRFPQVLLSFLTQIPSMGSIGLALHFFEWVCPVSCTVLVLGFLSRL